MSLSQSPSFSFGSPRLLGCGTSVAGPAAYFVRANQPQFSEPGTATRTRTKNGADSLTATGTATKGTKVEVEMTLVCQP